MGVRSILGRELAALRTDGKGLPLLAVASGWGLLVGTRMIYPVVLPSLQETYGLSLTVAGLLVSVLWLAGSIGQLPSGVLADRYDERVIMAASAFVVAVALALVVTTAAPVVLFLATALWGLGHSLYPIARITFLSNRYADRLGSALGVTMAAGDVGQTALPPVATAITVAAVWQVGLGFMAPVLVLAGVALLVAVPATSGSKPDAESQSLREALGVVRELRSLEMGFVVGILFLYILVWQSFTAFYPTYLTEVKGLSPSVASVLFGFFFAVGVVVKPLSGAAYDRVGMHGSLVGVLGPPVVGFLLLPLVDGVPLLAVATALVSCMLGTGAITQSHLADSFSEETQGTGLGVVRTVSATLGAAGPVAFGVMADYGYFDEGYVVLAVTMAVAVLLSFRMPGE